MGYVWLNGKIYTVCLHLNISVYNVLCCF